MSDTFLRSKNKGGPMTGISVLKSSFGVLNATFQQIDEDKQRATEINQLLTTGAISDVLSDENKAKALYRNGLKSWPSAEAKAPAV